MIHYLASSIIVLIAINARYVEACSCGAEPPVVEELESCTAIFSGRVLSRSTKAIVPATPGDFEEYTYTFLVDRIWKGQMTHNAAITTGTGGGDCGFPFEEGKEYLVYAYGSYELLATNICTRTRPISFALDDIKELGSPTGTISADDVTQGGAVYLIYALPVALVAFISAVLFVAHRKRQLP